MQETKTDYSSRSLMIRIMIGIASIASYLIYIITYRILRYRFSVVVNNLSRSFPQKTQKQIHSLARSYYRHLADLVVEPLLFVMVNADYRSKLASYTNIEILKKYYNNGDNLIALASHYGNWEYLINLPRIQPFTTFTAYTPLSNKKADSYILKLRSKFGVQLIAKRSFFRGALSVLKQNDTCSMIVVIADQRPAPGSPKYAIDFLGQPTRVQIGAERLARASGAKILFLECTKTSRFHYEYTFHLLSDNPEKCSALEITSNYYHLLERIILKSPSQWLWSHKRWKPFVEQSSAVTETV